jgi:hypothetical protein
MTTVPQKWSQTKSRLMFILSSERSGSTLLRVTMGRHSRIIAPSELWLMCFHDYEAWRQGWPFAIESLVNFFEMIDQPKTVAEIDALCQSLSTTDVYRWMLSYLAPDSLLLDKTPAYARDLNSMLRSRKFNPFYIWLIRHPLGVVDSHARLVRRHRDYPWIKVLVRKIIDSTEMLIGGGMTKLARRRESMWVIQNKNIRYFLSCIPENQKYVVHFEDLVTSTQVTLDKLCKAIGIALEPNMLSLNPRDYKTNPRIGDSTFHKRSSIDPSTAHRWKRGFSEHILRAKTLKLMRDIGVMETSTHSN